MLRRRWVAVMTALVGGATMLQTTACSNTAEVVTAVATTVSAGGVLFIIRRIIET